MLSSRSTGRRSSRALKPALNDRLEERVVLSRQSLRAYLIESMGLLNNPTHRAAKNLNNPPFAQNAPKWNREFRQIHAAATQTIRGGKAVNVVSVDGTQYRIQLSYISNTIATSGLDGQGGLYSQTTPDVASNLQPTGYPQAIGVVRAYAMPDGKVGIIVDGSTANTALTINPLPHAIRKGYAHSFAYGQAGQTHVLNIGQLTINSGQIGSVEGFHTANLSGPLVAASNSTIDRIAFNEILPGASITTGGSVNTLDVLKGITLNTGTNIQIGRDLNLFNVGQDISLSNGSQIIIGRDLGAILQPPKGTGSGSNVLTLNQSVIGTTFEGDQPPNVAAFIQGGLTIEPGSAVIIGRSVDNPIYIIGDVFGASRFVIPASRVVPIAQTILSVGTISQ